MHLSILQLIIMVAPIINNLLQEQGYKYTLQTKI